MHEDMHPITEKDAVGNGAPSDPVRPGESYDSVVERVEACTQ